HGAADPGEVDPRARTALEDEPLLGVPLEDRLHRVLDAQDEAGRALLLALLAPAHVEPDRAVEGAHLVEQDVGQLGLERLRVLLGGEVAAGAPPLRDPPGDAGDHLLDRALALGRAERAAEVLLGHDVGRVLRPALRELDAALLEGRVGRIADDGVADLPLDLVEGVDARGREATLDGQPAGLGPGGVCSALAHRILSCVGLSGWTADPCARPGRKASAAASSGIGSGSVPANWREAPWSSSRRPSRQSWPSRSAATSPPPLAAAASIRATRASTWARETRRLWVAASSEARSFSRLKRWREPSRLRTVSGSACTRSKVVKRLPQRPQARRLRTALPPSAGRLSSTRVGALQAGQITHSL